MKNIAIIGFMGAGKTMIGKLLAAKLGCKFVDIDRQIELQQGKSICEIFAQSGESVFRDIESTMIDHFSSMKNLVISTGGGAPLRQVNLENLRKNGLIVFLSASPQTVYERVKNSKNRPLLQTDDPFATICRLMQQRMPYYKKADLTVDTDSRSPYEIVQEILSYIKANR